LSIQDDGLQSFGNAVGTIAFRLFAQSSQVAASCGVEMQQTRQHGVLFRQYWTFSSLMSL
jgi:hypothetical protein